MPLVFALGGDTIYSAVDAKPKRSLALRRLANIAANPHVSLLVDHYDDRRWQELWWARADGQAAVLQPTSPAAARAVGLLTTRYGQYRHAPPAGPVIAVAVERWSGWSAADP